MKDLLTFVALTLWCASCASSPAPLPVHSVKTITTICPGPLCDICATAPEATHD